MWLAVSMTAAGEPGCAGRLYEGTLVEVGQQLAIPGVTLRADNPWKRERLTVCTDPTLSASAVTAWLTGATLLGYCVAFDGEPERPCDQDRRVWVGLDPAARAELAALFDAGTIQSSGHLTSQVGLGALRRGKIGGRRAEVTLLTP